MLVFFVFFVCFTYITPVKNVLINCLFNETYKERKNVYEFKVIMLLL